MKKNISFLVTGMHCASCEILIKDELSALTGVSDATVDFKTGKGSLILDLDKNSENDILLAIKKAGYTAVIDGASDSNLEKDNTEVIKKTIKPNEPFRVIFEVKVEGAENQNKVTEVEKKEDNLSKRVSLSLSGMHCTSCALIIEKSLFCFYSKVRQFLPIRLLFSCHWPIL